MKLEFELAYWQAKAGSIGKRKISENIYTPGRRQPPPRSLQVTSAWAGIETILQDIIDRFHVPTERCLEFGVEFGFSTVALSSYFGSVTGVDTFQGDKHTVNQEDIFQETSARLAGYPNITLVRSDYRDFIQKDSGSYGLIHVDIIHTYTDTFACGLWSAHHSQCTLFHDTESFPQVKLAVVDIARATGKTFYNFKESNGLGILV